jgi:predicted DNA-binding transcriptional regulator AlpA
MSQKNGNKTLIGIGAICEYLDMSKPTLYSFIEMGMPARIVNKRWYAHKDNIDEWFKQLTRHRIKEIEKDAQ